MTTEHVSVPRELMWRAVNAFQQCGMEGKANELQAILSRATPSDDLQGAFAECYTSENGLAMLRDPECGISTVARVKTDYSCIPLFLQPQTSAPRVVTEEDVEWADKIYWGSENAPPRRHPRTHEQGLRAALESFATSLPAAIPPGYVVVPVEPTEEMLEQACTHDTTPRNADKDQWNRDTWSFMLAAAPQAGERG